MDTDTIIGAGLIGLVAYFLFFQPTPPAAASSIAQSLAPAALTLNQPGNGIAMPLSGSSSDDSSAIINRRPVK